MEDLGKIKNDVLILFESDPHILDVLLGKIEDDDDIDYLLTDEASGSRGHIHKFEYVPDINETTCTYLNVEAAIVKTPATDTTYTVYLYVFAFCHKDIMENYHRAGAAGTRADILAADVDKLLNGNNSFGIGLARPINNNIYKPNNNYYGRVLTYEIQNFSRKRGS